MLPDTQHPDRVVNKIMGMNLIGGGEFMLGAVFNLNLLIVAFFAAVGVRCGFWIGLAALFDCIFCGGRKRKDKRYMNKTRKERKDHEKQESPARAASEQDENHIDYDGLELKRLYS